MGVGRQAWARIAGWPDNLAKIGLTRLTCKGDSGKPTSYVSCRPEAERPESL